MADGKMNTKKADVNVWVGVAIVVLVVLLGGYYLLNISKSKSSPTMIDETIDQQEMPPSDEEFMEGTEGATIEAEKDEDVMLEDEGNVKTIVIEGGSYYFKPDKITVKQGDRLKIVLNSVDKVHNFYLDEFEVKSSDAAASETTTVELTADKKGTFEFYCAIGEHRKLGMVGTLVVE